MNISFNLLQKAALSVASTSIKTANAYGRIFSVRTLSTASSKDGRTREQRIADFQRAVDASLKKEKEECKANPEEYWKQYWKRVIPHPVHPRDIELDRAMKEDEENLQQGKIAPQEPKKNDKS